MTRATFVPDIQSSITRTLASATGTFGYTGQRIDLETGGLYVK